MKDTDDGWTEISRREELIDLTDQQSLKKIVINTESWKVCAAAWEKITDFDPEFLEKVVRKGSNPDVCNAAIEKITNECLLKEIATSCFFSFDAQKAALKKITDQEFFKDIAINDAYKLYYDVRLVAIEKITNQAVLKNIAKNDFYPAVRKAATEKITDQDALKDRVKNDPGLDVRLAAIKNITDPEFLKEIVSAMGKILRESSGSLEERRHAADCLKIIYREASNNDSIKKDIQSYHGALIYGEREHVDYYTPDGRYTDDHHDTPVQPAEYFGVKEMY